MFHVPIHGLPAFFLIHLFGFVCQPNRTEPCPDWEMVVKARSENQSNFYHQNRMYGRINKYVRIQYINVFFFRKLQSLL